MRAIPVLCASLLLATCIPFVRPGAVRQERFGADALARWSAHADEGHAWRVADRGLEGSGRQIQGVLVLRGQEMRDGWVEAETSHADDGGLVMGFRDNGNYLLLAIRDDAAPYPRGAENLKLYRRRNGRYETLWEADVRWRRGEPRVVRMEARDGRITVLLDGEPVGSVHEAVPAGGFGLRHYGGSKRWRVRYDAFRWSRARD